MARGEAAISVEHSFVSHLWKEFYGIPEPSGDLSLYGELHRGLFSVNDLNEFYPESPMTTTAARPQLRSNRRTAIDEIAVQERARRLVETEVSFISNPEFACDLDDCRDEIDEILRGGNEVTDAPQELPAHLSRMCEVALLSHEEEATLFREMNRLKYHANSLRVRLDPEAPDEATMDELESLLDRAREIRDHLVKANMRLAISIVKKFVTPQLSFDDLLSNASMTLMQAVEKFDFDRGFRFSTYAYRSISRNVFRALASARKEEARFTRDAEEWAFEQVDERATIHSDDVWKKLSDQTAAFLKHLDRREQLIIRCRYALGRHRKVRTFQYIADKLGVSKERVRQLEQRAVGKLKAMAEQLDPDSLFGATLA